MSVSEGLGVATPFNREPFSGNAPGLLAVVTQCHFTGVSIFRGACRALPPALGAGIQDYPIDVEIDFYVAVPDWIIDPDPVA